MSWRRQTNRAGTSGSRIGKVGRSAGRALMDTAVESARDGITKVSEKVGGRDGCSSHGSR